MQKLFEVAEYVLHKSLLTAVVVGLIISIIVSPDLCGPCESGFSDLAVKSMFELGVKLAIFKAD
jgi:hypothetical protein